MNIFKKMKDGGAESKVTGYFLAEIKSLFSVVLLHFEDGSREAYHSHAFNALSWVLRGRLDENTRIDARTALITTYTPSMKPIVTRRSRMHKVVSLGDTWVISFRGPWVDKWNEYLPNEDKTITLTHGRKIVA